MWAEQNQQMNSYWRVLKIFGFLLIWLNTASIFDIYLVEYIILCAANLKYTIFK